MTQQLLMKKIMALDCMAIDLGLFLDTHPYDKEALKTYKSVTDESKKVREKYEAEYGALTARHTDDDKWCWIDEPWPWQKEAGFSLRGE